MARSIFALLFLCIVSLGLKGQKDSSASSDLFVGLGLHQGTQQGGSFLLPSVGWEKRGHRITLGAVLGASYVAKAGSRGGRWISSRNAAFRGANLSYDLRLWKPASTVRLRGGLASYYFFDAYSQQKGKEDPMGKSYAYEHEAYRRSFALAPSIAVEFLPGADFSLRLGFQPLRYQRSEYRWDPKGAAISKGGDSKFRFGFKTFEVKYRP